MGKGFWIQNPEQLRGIKMTAMEKEMERKLLSSEEKIYLKQSQKDK